LGILGIIGIFQVTVKLQVILEFQGEKELHNNFDEPDNGQNSFVNNIYLGHQSKKFLPIIEG